MKIRFAQPVSTTDGVIGQLGDVVVDPITREITHLVVELQHRHQHARSVPIGLVDFTDEGATIRLDSERFRDLPVVAESDFIKMGREIDLGEKWDVGIEHVVALPYTARGMTRDLWADTDQLAASVSVDYDRIPKGDCEIRRQSRVVAADGHVVGLVDGFLADETHIEGVIVQTGLPGFRHLVVIPIGSVTRVANDRITLSIDKRVFHRLVPVAEFDDPRGLSSRFERIERSMARVSKRCRQRLHGVVHRDGSRSPASDDTSRIV